MSGNLQWSEPAQVDMLEIWLYIATDDMEAADKIIKKIRSACAMLADYPLAGISRTDLHESPRSFAVGNYVIFYDPFQGGVMILRILHGARSLEGLFGAE